MTKIKILQTVGAPAGGIGKHIVDILSGLDQEVFEVDLVASMSDADNCFINNFNQSIKKKKIF